MFSDLVEASDAEVNLAFAYECWDVGCWEEDEGDREVAYECNVETVFTAELYVGAFEEVECSLL